MIRPVIKKCKDIEALLEEERPSYYFESCHFPNQHYGLVLDHLKDQLE